MPRTFSSRTTHPVGGSPAAQGGLWYDLPTDGFNRRDTGILFNDFVQASDYDVTNDWTETNVGATPTGAKGVTAVNSTSFGILQIQAGESDGEGYSIQVGKGGVLPSAGRVIAAELRMTHSAWIGSHFFFGLCETGAALDGNGTLGGALELVGFHVDHDVTTTGIPVLSAAGGNNTVITYTPTAAIPALTNATYYTFGVRIEETNRVYFYFNGVRVGGGLLASAYTASMFITLAHVANAASTPTLRCDYFAVGQSR